MIEQKMETALNLQINAEIWSRILYLSMSYDMDDKGYEGIASWFYLQAVEEFEHATRIVNYIKAQGGKVRLMPIEGVKQEWDSPKDAFADTLAHEKVVTGKIHKLMDLAIELKDYATQNMLNWFINEQVEEEDTASKILEQLKRIESSPAGLYALDKKLGKRKKDN
jgi:ferritin